MSEICIIDLSKNNFSSQKREFIARQLLKISVKKKFGITFRGDDEKYLKYKMNFYFYLSDSPLYSTSDLCDFTNQCFYEENKIRKNVVKKFNSLINCLRSLIKIGCSEIDVYITDDIYEFEELNFKKIESKKNSYIKDIIDYFEKNIDIYQTDFIPVLINITNE